MDFLTDKSIKNYENLQFNQENKVVFGDEEELYGPNAKLVVNPDMIAEYIDRNQQEIDQVKEFIREKNEEIDNSSTTITNNNRNDIIEINNQENVLEHN
jgi:hypothetical protein